MNREILFKAKRIDNGEWIEGYYFYNPNIDRHFIHTWLTGGLVEVDENTLCQYTGLKDKNGNKIWENDIVFVTDDDGNSGMVDTGIGEIYFLEGLWYISGSVQNELYDINQYYQIEVVGNVFDNPELIDAEQKQKEMESEVDGEELRN